MMLTNIAIVLLLSIKLVQALKLNYLIPGPRSYNDRIGIVGAGSAGIHMALLLKQKGFNYVEILESSARIGGKSYTIMHRNVPHEMGTCFLSLDYHTSIIALVKKYVPGDLIDLVTASVSLDGSLHSVYFYIYAVCYVGRFLNTKNTTCIKNHILDSTSKYILLHKQLFGEYEGEIPPEPSLKVKNRINGTFIEFLTREDLLALIPFLEVGHVMQGYGLLDEIPTLYGLIWITPKFIEALVGTIKKYLFNHQRSDAGTYTLKNGFQKLWEKLVETENFTIHFNTKVTELKRQKVSQNEPNSYISIVTTQDTKTNTTNSRTYDFLIWTPEMKESLPLWNDHFGKEAEYFSKTYAHYFTTALIHTVNETRRISPITYYMKSQSNEMYGNRIIVQRDSYATINRFKGLLYENGIYPVSKDHLNVMSTVNYIMAKTKQSQKELYRKFIEHKQYLKAKKTSVLQIEQWRYFPRYSKEDIESGILWRILEMQGKYGIWYAGSSVSFESVKSVAEYNKILLSNMDTHTKHFTMQSRNSGIKTFEKK